MKLLVLLVVLLFSFPNRSYTEILKSEDDFKSVVYRQLQMYPEMLLLDVLKIAYQSAMGPSHLLKYGEDNAKKYLYKEYESVIPDSVQYLTEDISNGFIRVNLSKYKSLGLNIDTLFTIMIESAKLSSPDTNLLEKNIAILEEMLKNNLLHYNFEELIEYKNKLHSTSYAPFHHSEKYSLLYNPQYRIVLQKIFEEKYGTNLK